MGCRSSLEQYHYDVMESNRNSAANIWTLAEQGVSSWLTSEVCGRILLWVTHKRTSCGS